MSDELRDRIKQSMIDALSRNYGGGTYDDAAQAVIDEFGLAVDVHNTLPALLTAVEKVLELHEESSMQRKIPLSMRETAVDHEAFTWCICCEDRWPCPTVRAIEGATND